MRIVGIDPSSKRLALCVTETEDEHEKPQLLFSKLEQDHIKGCGTAFRFIAEFLGDSDDPCAVYMEKPIMGMGGPEPTIVQAQIGGAVMAACEEMLTPLVLVNNQRWKKQVCGRGNINKEEVSELMEEVWPEAYEAVVEASMGRKWIDQDLIDSTALNRYGLYHQRLRRRVRRRARGSEVGS